MRHLGERSYLVLFCWGSSLGCILGFEGSCCAFLRTMALVGLWMLHWSIHRRCFPRACQENWSGCQLGRNQKQGSRPFSMEILNAFKTRPGLKKPSTMGGDGVSMSFNGLWINSRRAFSTSSIMHRYHQLSLFYSGSLICFLGSLVYTADFSGVWRYHT